MIDFFSLSRAQLKNRGSVYLPFNNRTLEKQHTRSSLEVSTLVCLSHLGPTPHEFTSAHTHTHKASKLIQLYAQQGLTIIRSVYTPWFERLTQWSDRLRLITKATETSRSLLVTSGCWSSKPVQAKKPTYFLLSCTLRPHGASPIEVIIASRCK